MPSDPTTTNPDAAFLTAIEDWKQAWSEAHRLDDEAAGLDDAATKAVRLDQKIARMPAMTVEGCYAKVEVVRAAGFDDDLLLAITFLLGRTSRSFGSRKRAWNGLKAIKEGPSVARVLLTPQKWRNTAARRRNPPPLTTLGRRGSSLACKHIPIARPRFPPRSGSFLPRMHHRGRGLTR